MWQASRCRCSRRTLPYVPATEESIARRKVKEPSHPAIRSPGPAPHALDCSIIALDKFIQATRDSGYKGTASAISELVDNSIQAGAKRIAITVAPKAATDDDDKSLEVSVLDNGCGMDPFTLRQALRFGGSTRFGDRG